MKKLILDLAHIKDKNAKTELNSAFQQTAFKAGFSWGGGEQTVKHPDAAGISLTVKDDGTLRMGMFIEDADMHDIREQHSDNPDTLICDCSDPLDGIIMILALQVMFAEIKAKKASEGKDNDEVVRENIEGVQVSYCKHGSKMDATELLNRVEQETKRRATAKFGELEELPAGATPHSWEPEKA